MYKDLLKECMERLVDIGFDGYAIGGLSVGEKTEMMYEMTDISTNHIPANSPRYLMGVGTPENILNAIALGIDMFDCVMPTRNARNGQLFTTEGKINIKNSQFRLSDAPIDPVIESDLLYGFTLGYLRHLFMTDEILGVKLASIQNINFYQWLTEQAREHIRCGDFEI